MIYKYIDKVEELEAAEAFDDICSMFTVLLNAENRVQECIEQDDMANYQLNMGIYNEARSHIYNMVERHLTKVETQTHNLKITSLTKSIEEFEKRIKFLEEENAALTKVAEAYGLEYCYTVDELKEMYKPGGREID